MQDLPPLPKAPPEWKDFPRPGEDVAARRQKGERAVERSETERVHPCKQTLSVTAFGRATSPERERLWQRRKVYSLTAGFFLPLTGEDETHPLCQGLPPEWKDFPRPGEDVAARRQKGEPAVERSETERVRPRKQPSPSRPLAVPPLPRGRGFGREGKCIGYRLTGAGR